MKCTSRVTRNMHAQKVSQQPAKGSTETSASQSGALHLRCPDQEASHVSELLQHLGDVLNIGTTMMCLSSTHQAASRLGGIAGTQNPTGDSAHLYFLRLALSLLNELQRARCVSKQKKINVYIKKSKKNHLTCNQSIYINNM